MGLLLSPLGGSALAQPQRLSPGGARALSLQQSEMDGLPGGRGFGEQGTGLLYLSDPPVRLCP